MTLLDDIRAAGLDARLGEDGRLQVSGPADVRDRLRNALHGQRDQLIAELQAAARSGPVQQGTLDFLIYAGPCDPEHRTCDHVYCATCGQWANDTGAGPSCHPRPAKQTRFDSANIGGVVSPPVTLRRSAKQIRAEIRHWQGVAKMWRDGGFPDTHVDHGLEPGTDEGDCSAQYRREMEAEAKSHVATLQAELSR